MNSLKRLRFAPLVLFSTLAVIAETRATLPPPVLVAPADGALLVQSIKIDWDPVIDPNGEIGSYSWQVGKSSDFKSVVLEGFTSMLFAGVPAATDGQVSGLANGTYFWRVKASSLASGDSAWSTPRSFTVTGLGAAPAFR